MNKFTQTILVVVLFGALLLFTAFPVYCSDGTPTAKSKDPKKISPPINVKVEPSKNVGTPEWKICDPDKGTQAASGKKQPAKLVEKKIETIKESAEMGAPGTVKHDNVSVTESDDLLIKPESGEPPLKLTLHKALNLAAEADNDLRIAIARIKAAEGKFYEAKSAKNVTLDAVGTYNRIDPVSEVSLGGQSGKPASKIKLGANDNFSGKLILQKIITTFGNLENTITATVFNIAAARENLETTRQNLVYNVKSDYYKALKTRGLVDVSKENLDLVRAQLKKTNDMYDAGVVPRFEVIRSEYFVSQARQNLITSRKLYELDLSVLRDALGLNLDKPIDLEKENEMNTLKVDYEEASKLAVENRPELKSLRFSLDASRKLLDAAKSNRNPVLAFNSTVENKTISGLSSEATTWTNYLTLSFPLFDGGETKGKVIQAEASLKELEETYDKTEKSIKLDVKKALLDLMEIEAKLEASERDVITSEAAYNIALARYENGISTTLELNDVRRTMNTSRIEYVNLKYEYNIAIARLERATSVVWKGEGR